MAQTKEGALKLRAKRAGVTFERCAELEASGYKWCWKCHQWKPRTEYNADRSRFDNLCSVCMECRESAYPRVMHGPTRRNRVEMLSVGMKWCSGCKAWLQASEVHAGLCRHHQNEAARARYKNNETCRFKARQHAHSRRRRVEPVPVEGAEYLLECFEGKCAYCDRDATTWDHVFPISHGGLTEPGNIVPCCRYCNSSKRNCNVWEWIGKRKIKLKDALISILILGRHAD